MKNFDKIEYVDVDGDKLEVMRNSLLDDNCDTIYLRIENDSYDVPDVCGMLLNKEQALELAHKLLEIYE